jgi:hypothetical protein
MNVRIKKKLRKSSQRGEEVLLRKALQNALYGYCSEGYSLPGILLVLLSKE